MSSRLIYGYLIGGLLLALIYFIAIPLYETKIPTSLQKHVQEQLNTQGYSWASASANGRDITLQGKAPTIASYDEALDLTQSLTTVRSVKNQLKHTVISPYSLNAEWKDKELNIKGHLPDQKSMSEVNNVLKNMYSDSKVVSQLTVGKGAPEGWSDLAKAALENTPQLDRVNIDIVDHSLDLSAKTALSVDSDRLIGALKPFEARGYTLKINVVAEDVAAMRCQRRFNQLLKATSISFDSGKTSINPKSIPLLQTLADTAQLCPGLSILISGHTDNRGSAAKNQSLSRQRAEAVATWLISSGLDTKLLKTVGYGSSKPIADNATDSGRSSNRRIEFTVQEK